MSNTTKYQYDYIIIGNGLAGLQLALSFAEHPFFLDKTVALIDKSSKDINDKTWSFWEIGEGKWDNIVFKSWDKSRFVSPNVEVIQNLKPYKYKSVKSIDFYKYAKSILKKNANFSFFIDSVTTVDDSLQKVSVKGQNKEYTGLHIFDSRIPSAYYKDKKSISLIQHFKGYFIECERDVFNPEQITVMDYRLRHNNSTSFIYILPQTTKKALIEYTFFTPNLVEDKVYDNHLKKYIEDFLKLTTYKIEEIEHGNIPMTDFDFEKFNTDKITKIGTGGGWVKGSTGYSFKHTEFKVQTIITNLEKGLRPSYNLSKKRFKFYDSIFLQVLHDYNEQGMSIFEKFYTKNRPQDYYEFLDEASTVAQELKIMMSMYSPIFIKSLIKKLLR